MKQARISSSLMEEKIAAVTKRSALCANICQM
jgi:hypothetical protein